MSNELKVEFRKVKDEALAIVAKAQAEKRDLTADEVSSNEQRFARLDTISKTVAEQARFAALEMADVPADVLAAAKGNPPESKAKQEFESGRTGRISGTAHHDAVNQFMRSGTVPPELFTIMTGTSGVALPAGTPVVIKRQNNPYKAALQAFGYQILNVAGFGNVPIFNDTGNVADIIAQDSTSENVKEPVITNLTGDVLYDSGTSWFSNTYLAQAGFDPLSYLRPMLDARIEAAEVASWTTALTTPAASVVGSSTTGITYQDLVNLKYSLPVAAQADGVFFVSSGLMAAIEGMIDSTGRPLIRESLSDDAPNRLLGWPVFVTAGLATPAANAKTAVVASASALVVRESGPRRLVRYDLIPTRPDQVGIREFANGGLGVYTGNVKVFAQHA